VGIGPANNPLCLRGFRQGALQTNGFADIQPDAAAGFSEPPNIELSVKIHMQHMPTWLIPFRGRNHSGAVEQNFLWREGNSFIMDNHRAALWCWLQEMQAHDSVGLMHIDEHYDTLRQNIQAEIQHLPELRSLSVHDYLALTINLDGRSTPLIRWDNYLSLFLERYGEKVVRSVFATHEVGDRPVHHDARYPKPQDVPENIDFWMQSIPDQWLVNVDLDYFFFRDHEGSRKPMFSDQYVKTVFEAIAGMQRAGRIKCLTICLSPDKDCSGGWPQAEQLCSTACQILGLQFSLPNVCESGDA
jgi:hypothetical protein